MNENAIGALWLNKSKKGVTYMSGEVEIDGQKTKVVIFKNKYKDAENKPDYKIYKSEPKQERQETPQEKAVTSTFVDDDPDSSIPF